MSYLQKLVSTDSFKFKRATSFSNQDRIDLLEKVREDYPEYIIELKNPIPSSSVTVKRKDAAKVYFLVDVSGSVDRAMKEHFAAIQEGVIDSLNEDYVNVYHGVILHHTQAKDPVTGFDWVDDAETGGTIVSSAYEVAAKNINERSNTDYYIVQLTDGDNWADDTPTTNKKVNELAIEGIKGFKYFEVGGRPTQTLYKAMMKNDCVEVFRMQRGSLELLKDSK